MYFLEPLGSFLINILLFIDQKNEGKEGGGGGGGWQSCEVRDKHVVDLNLKKGVGSFGLQIVFFWRKL